MELPGGRKVDILVCSSEISVGSQPIRYEYRLPWSSAVYCLHQCSYADFKVAVSSKASFFTWKIVLNLMHFNLKPAPSESHSFLVLGKLCILAGISVRELGACQKRWSVKFSPLSKELAFSLLCVNFLSFLRLALLKATVTVKPHNEAGVRGHLLCLSRDCGNYSCDHVLLVFCSFSTKHSAM